MPFIHQLQSIAEDTTSRLYVVSLVVVIGTYALFKFSQEPAPYPGIEPVGPFGRSYGYSDAKANYFVNAPRVLMEGLKKCKGAFQVVTTSGPKIVLPGRYIEEIKNNPSMEFAVTTAKQFFGHIPGLELFAEVDNGEIIQEAVRIRLTQSLAALTPDLVDEASFATTTVLGDNEEWHEVDSVSASLQLIARVSARAFLGERLCRDPEWLKISMEYAMASFNCVRILRLWWKPLRPIVHWFLPQFRALRTTQKRAKEIIYEESSLRKAKWAAAGGNKKATYNDSLAWFEQTARGRPYSLADCQLALTFAAIHTTSDLLAKFIYDVCAYPEMGQALRQEIIKELSEKGWKKTTLYNMKLLDSALKESQRISPSSLTPLARYCVKPVTLSDGTYLPAGSHVTVMADRLRDASVYEDCDKFKASRFLELRKQPGHENGWQFVTTSMDHIGFGHGQHACPGRFFASNETKIILCYLLLRYDFKLMPGMERPENMWAAAECMPNIGSRIMIRRNREFDSVLEDAAQNV